MKKPPVRLEKIAQGVFADAPEVVRYSTAVQRLRDQHAPQEALDEFARDKQAAAVCPTHGPIDNPIIGLLSDRVAFGCPECSGSLIQGIYKSEAPLLREWCAQLASLRGPDGCLAREMWSKLCRTFQTVPIPQAGPLPDGGFQFVWDRGDHHLEIDVLPDAKLEWFYRNRKTGEVAGEDVDAGDLPGSLRTRFALLQ